MKIEYLQAWFIAYFVCKSIFVDLMCSNIGFETQWEMIFDEDMAIESLSAGHA